MHDFRGANRKLSRKVSLAPTFKNNAEILARWEEAKAFHQQKGRWPKRSEGRPGSFTQSLRSYAKGEKKGAHVYPPELILEARKLGVFNEVTHALDDDAPQSRPRGGALARVEDALRNSRQPETKDVADLRRGYRDGRLSEGARNRLQSLGLDIT